MLLQILNVDTNPKCCFNLFWLFSCLFFCLACLISRHYLTDYRPDFCPNFRPDFCPDFRPDFRPDFHPDFVTILLYLVFSQPSDDLISISYLMPAFCANSFGVFLFCLFLFQFCPDFVLISLNLVFSLLTILFQ